MEKKLNKILIVCDGVKNVIEVDYSAETIHNFITMHRERQNDGVPEMVTIKEGFYVDPNKVTLIRDITDEEIVLKIGSEELGRVCIDAINTAQRKYSISPVEIKS
ncbi:hypothetical protein [Clostridium baratii]|uniref:hypothetical protein n=1 Tax=Clostridium baratii TaxID=1561 RepID=UPI0030CCC492